MSLKTDVMVTSYVIYEDPANDDTHRDFLLSAMGDLEPLADPPGEMPDRRQLGTAATDPDRPRPRRRVRRLPSR
jgi:hypothetical protein